jgi:hypothetical protein
MLLLKLLLCYFGSERCYLNFQFILIACELTDSDFKVLQTKILDKIVHTSFSISSLMYALRWIFSWLRWWLARALLYGRMYSVLFFYSNCLMRISLSRIYERILSYFFYRLDRDSCTQALPRFSSICSCSFGWTSFESKFKKNYNVLKARIAEIDSGTVCAKCSVSLEFISLFGMLHKSLL